MQSYRGIEGARAWLAWTVVLGHVVELSGIASKVPALEAFVAAGPFAVTVFMIISGFVITHLLLSKREPYPIYMTRRALRIYPTYLVCLLFGILTAPLLFDVLTHLPWADLSAKADVLQRAHEVARGHAALHLLVHVLLIHGIFPIQVLNQAYGIFLAPAWSLSLEWQFYLLAPAIIWGLRRRGWSVLVVAVTGLGLLAFRHGSFGGFPQPSMLLASGPWFLVGIGSRLALDHLPRLSAYPTSFVLGGALIATLYSHTLLLPLAAWLIVIAYAQLQPQALSQREPVTRILRGCLDSRLAQAAGARSYAVYLIHWPLLSAVLYFGFGVCRLGPWPLFGLAFATTIALTAIGSDLLHRFVELPAIDLGRRLMKPQEAQA